jgi:hypothetical protein
VHDVARLQESDGGRDAAGTGRAEELVDPAEPPADRRSVRGAQPQQEEARRAVHERVAGQDRDGPPVRDAGGDEALDGDE